MAWEPSPSLRTGRQITEVRCGVVLDVTMPGVSALQVHVNEISKSAVRSRARPSPGSYASWSCWRP
eukprot:6489584-Amphidinium_carterae.1